MRCLWLRLNGAAWADFDGQAKLAHEVRALASRGCHPL